MPSDASQRRVSDTSYNWKRGSPTKCCLPNLQSSRARLKSTKRLAYTGVSIHDALAARRVNQYGRISKHVYLESGGRQNMILPFSFHVLLGVRNVHHLKAITSSDRSRHLYLRNIPFNIPVEQAPLTAVISVRSKSTSSVRINVAETSRPICMYVSKLTNRLSSRIFIRSSKKRNKYIWASVGRRPSFLPRFPP